MSVVCARSCRDERGEVSWIGLAILLALAGASYMAWVWVPVYLRAQQVEQVVRSAANLAVKEPDDAKLVDDMLRRLRAVAAVEVERDGRVEAVPLVDVRPQDVTWERDVAARKLHVAVAYSETVVYPWIGRTQDHVTAVDLTEDIAMVDWGKK